MLVRFVAGALGELTIFVTRLPRIVLRALRCLCLRGVLRLVVIHVGLTLISVLLVVVGVVWHLFFSGIHWRCHALSDNIRHSRVA